MSDVSSTGRHQKYLLGREIFAHGTPNGLTLAGEEVDGTFEHGFLMYGNVLKVFF